MDEKIKIKKTPIHKKIKCLKKKRQSFVFSLSDAINEVDTREKNKPTKNNKIISVRINLSIFFHHL